MPRRTALEAVDELLAVRLERRAAALADGPHLQAQALAIQSTETGPGNAPIASPRRSSSVTAERPSSP